MPREALETWIFRGNKEKVDSKASLISKQKLKFDWDNRNIYLKAKLHLSKVPIYIFTKKKACKKSVVVSYGKTAA